jgi:dienelactone hydrolase
MYVCPKPNMCIPYSTSYDYLCRQLAPFDREKWHESHGSAQTRPSIDQVIAALKREGVTSFAATGYCFGGKSQ